MAQLTRELGLIERLGYADYFLFVADVARFCTERGILMQGRGSAANSVVAYVLGITEVDPLQATTSSSSASSPPSARIRPTSMSISSTSAGRRSSSMSTPGGGGTAAAMVCNVNTYRGRSALIDVGKALGIPLPRLHRLTKALGHAAGAEMETGIAAATEGPSRETLHQLAALTAALEGLPRHASIHNGGMVVTARPLAESVPIETRADEGTDRDDLG